MGNTRREKTSARRRVNAPVRVKVETHGDPTRGTRSSCLCVEATEKNHRSIRPSSIPSISNDSNQSNPRAACARMGRHGPGKARATRPVAGGGAPSGRRAGHVFDTGQARSAVALLVLAWLPIVAWHEHVAFRVTSASCGWPELEGTTSASSDARVAVIADPQVTDFTSYRSFAPKGSWTLEAIERVSDAYQHRAFRLAVLPKRPEHVVFLGDLLDGGWLTPDDETFDATARRFERIFRWPRRDAFGDSPKGPETDAQKKYLSVHGNHDVGYALRAESFPEIRARHEARFGVSNYVQRVGGVELVGVNAMALDGNPRSEATKDAWAFVDALAGNVSSGSLPRVLLTHLPLPKVSYAPGSCGESRFGPVIQPRTRKTRRGVEYQDYLSDASAARLLRAARPSLVLAGHDHDRCAASHEIPGLEATFGTGPGDGDRDGDATKRRSTDLEIEPLWATVTELTLGTFSWLMGNPKPSFALMTLRGEGEAAAFPKNVKHVDTAICELPDHLAGVWSYAYLGGFSAFVLLVWPSLRISAAFMCSGDIEAFARRVGIDPRTNAFVTGVDPVATWTRVVAVALWRHCGPFFVALVLVLGGIAGGTLWDLSRP